jgi:hypothetical protein
VCVIALLLAGVLPWASLAAAWELSGQWWLGVIALLAGLNLGIQLMGSIGLYLDSRERS